MLVMTPIYNEIGKTKSGHECLGTALMVAASTCVFSLLCGSILGFLHLRQTKIIPTAPVKAGDEIKLSDALKFPASLWFVSGICVTYYCAVFPFISLGKVFFISKFDFAPSTANQVNR